MRQRVGQLVGPNPVRQLVDVVAQALRGDLLGEVRRQAPDQDVQAAAVFGESGP